MGKTFLGVALVICLSAYSQLTHSVKKHLTSKEEMDSVINNLITEDYYVNKKDELKVVFTFKIDSLGEIHSAHIRWSKNLTQKSYYEICHKIEKDLLAKFLFDHFKDEEVFQKYVSCDYPFFSKR